MKLAMGENQKRPHFPTEMLKNPISLYTILRGTFFVSIKTVLFRNIHNNFLNFSVFE